MGPIKASQQIPEPATFQTMHSPTLLTFHRSICTFPFKGLKKPLVGGTIFSGK